MSRTRAAVSSPVLVAAALLVAACGGGTATASPAVSPAASPSAAASEPASPAASPSESAAASPASPSASATGEQIEVVGVEYAYQNVPATTPAGTTFTFRNGGQEVHEMLVVRRGEGVTQTWQELLAQPQEAVADLATVVGNSFAAPGQPGPGSVTADEPGDYVMVCFIPTGTTSLPDDANATLPPGAPHFTRGMLQEFTVTE